MPDLHDTDEALAEQTVADAFACTRDDRVRSFPWHVVGFLAGLLLALLSAPFVAY